MELSPRLNQNTPTFNWRKYVAFTPKKAIWGLALGFVVLVLSVFCGYVKSGMINWFLCAFFGSFKLKNESLWASLLSYAVWALVGIFIVTTMSPISYDGSIRSYLSDHLIILNFLCGLLVGFFFFVCTNKPGLSVSLATGIIILLYGINAAIFQFRGKELGPMDIFSVQTALNVAGGYTFSMPLFMARNIITWVVILFIQGSLPKAKLTRPFIWRTVSACLLCLCIITVNVFSQGITLKTWNDEGSRLNGYCLNFYLATKAAFVNKPDGYSHAAIAALEQETEKVIPAEIEKKPNIIVIMDESFSDFRIFGGELNTSKKIMPFIDSLQENTIKGNALASVFAGNTCNSEFEFLTSHSMGFLPTDAVPYQQYIADSIYTLPWLLQSYGYDTFATHPYHASGWSRDKLYPKFGFAASTFLEDYPQKNMLRNFVSDREMFDYMLNKLKNRESNAPQFFFGVTMQNHGGYDFGEENFKKTVTLSDYPGQYPEAEQYFTLLRETDNAVKYLITQLKRYKEDTILLFFGDHMPQIENDLYNKLNGGYFYTLDEKLNKYTVPFFIWANYDIPEGEVPLTSLNYLATHLLKAADLPLSPYYQVLDKLEETVPAISAGGYYSLTENMFLPIEKATGKEKEVINTYKILQYNNLFDKRHRSPVFYKQYMTHQR